MSKQKHDYIFGLHATRQHLSLHSERIVELWVQSGRDDDKINSLISDAQQAGIHVHSVAKKTLDKLSNMGQHQGVVLRTKPVKKTGDVLDLLDTLEHAPFLLVLDSVQDPHNLGACLRSADATGVDAVIIPKNRACSISSPVVHKVACGAADTVPVFEVPNLVHVLKQLKEQNIWVVGTAGESSQNVYQTKLTGALALVLGAEGTGLRRLTRETCDELIHIPMLGQVESLNVSVATGVCLYEAIRQRYHNG